MRFVPIKTLEQQAVLCLHRVRQGFIEERTATINRLRGLLAEFGFVLPQRAAEVRRGVAECSSTCRRTLRARSAICASTFAPLDERVREYERSIEAHARANRAPAQLAAAPGHRSDHRLGDRRQRRRCARVQERPPVLRLARARPATALHRRQDSGSATSPVAAIRTCARCSSWARERAAARYSANRIRSRAGRSPCERAAATTALASRWPPRTRASCGRLLSHGRPFATRRQPTDDLQSLRDPSPTQVRPTLANPVELLVRTNAD